ncbi:ribosomal large subunit pseudouridine synthase D [Salsuginibacillus halophilus]|uniref:Pseudouridine synthase n=1 Tax=Salsuginibacillus halophilus TaxID=517424 RepID=A0A2P8HWY0_9BACI|nr:RluA family pseudouridine synthase [Salsuginibacillus halophilus]PSL50753.1 ribosomal large subunit pseudouridine synthase D [Salsuginibacillus halophilus]
MNETITLNVTEEEANERMDKYITARVEGASRSEVQRWIEEGGITCNQTPTKANVKVAAGDVISVTPPEQDDAIHPEVMQLDAVFEDEDVIVINKPRGMVVHPAPGHTSGTLVNGLLAHTDELSDLNGSLYRPGIVHRIDKDTSGLLVVAKNNQAHEILAEQFKDKTASRRYQAIVHGEIAHERGTIEAPIGRDTTDRQRMAVTDVNSKEAVTYFQVLERFKNYSLVECQLETGRTHQIRVHFEYINHPVAGDPKYGPKKTLPLSGQALHAFELSFEHPSTGVLETFQAAVPKDMEEMIEKLR